MQTATRAAVTPAVDFDTRLALAGVGMDALLAQAQLVFEINTAHLPTEVVDFSGPILPALDPQPVTLTPLADVLHRAHRILQKRGWTKGGLRDEQGAVCLGGAIRAAATSRGQADEACAIVLDAIQRQFEAETVPSWNDQQNSATPVLRILGAAANDAADRGI